MGSVSILISANPRMTADPKETLTFFGKGETPSTLSIIGTSVFSLPSILKWVYNLYEIFWEVIKRFCASPKNDIGGRTFTLTLLKLEGWA